MLDLPLLQLYIFNIDISVYIVLFFIFFSILNLCYKLLFYAQKMCFDFENFIHIQDNMYKCLFDAL